MGPVKCDTLDPSNPRHFDELLSLYGDDIKCPYLSGTYASTSAEDEYCSPNFFPQNTLTAYGDDNLHGFDALGTNLPVNHYGSEQLTGPYFLSPPGCLPELESSSTSSSNSSSPSDLFEANYKVYSIDDSLPDLFKQSMLPPAALMDNANQWFNAAGTSDTPRTIDAATPRTMPTWGTDGKYPTWSTTEVARQTTASMGSGGIRGSRLAVHGRSGIGWEKKKQLCLDPFAAARPAAATVETQKRFFCKQPECAHLAFSRHADLGRHILHVHRPPGLKQRFYCDYPGCNRSRNPHHRKDHFRDHLRDVHREDLIKHGSNAHGPSPTSSVSLSAAATATTATLSAKQKMERLWLCSLPTDLSWWRCSKCLSRVPVAEKGYTCCKTPIEPIRLEVRKTQRDMQGALLV